MGVFNTTTFLMLSTLILCVHSLKITKTSDKEIAVEKGRELNLVCTADEVVEEALNCTFKGPNMQTYNFTKKGSKADNDRLQQYALTNKDCGMKITSVKEGDFGKWECSVTKNAGTSKRVEKKDVFTVKNASSTTTNGAATLQKVGGMAVLLVLCKMFA